MSPSLSKSPKAAPRPANGSEKTGPEWAETSMKRPWRLRANRGGWRYNVANNWFSVAAGFCFLCAAWYGISQGTDPKLITIFFLLALVNVLFGYL